MSTLEDTQFSDPGLVQFISDYYVPRGYPPGITAESVHMYFLNSPFLEKTSNNGLLKNQANAHNPDLVWDRKALESKLDKMAGVEYRVVDGPDTSFGPGGMGNPVWVIRKQVRVKKGEVFKVASVEATYFVMGEFIYMAPSLEDVLRVRLMAATRALQKFYAAANELYFYTPDRGYTYHSTTSTSKSKSSNLLESTRTSRANSPIPDTASQTSVQPPSTGTKEPQNQGNDDRAIAMSFQLAVRWGNEYMDENPLIGEPGALKLSSTSRQLKDQQDKNQAAEASKTAQKEKEKEAESTRASVAATPTPAPPAIKTDLKKSSMSKGKSPISAVSDGGIKKAGRRKSMKPGTPGVGSPGS